MNKKLILFALTFIGTTVSLDAWRGGGYHGGYRGGYHGGYHGGYWGGAGAGIATGAIVGTTVGLAASSGSRNNNSVNPVDQAEAEQIRYETSQQRQEDRDRRYNNDDNNSDSYDDDRSYEIQRLKEQIAQLESMQ